MSAWTLIEHIEVGSGGAATIEFDSIPQDATDLCFLVSMRSTTSGSEHENINLTFNASGSDFSFRMLRGSGSAASSASESVPFFAYAPRNGTTSNTFGNAILYIPNYAGSTNKSYSVDFVTEANQTGSWQAIVAGLWSNTAAITSVVFAPVTNNFAQYSSATLYGITKGSSGGVTVS